MEAVTAPLLIGAHADLKKFEMNSVLWHCLVGSIFRIMDDAAEAYGDKLFILMLMKFRKQHGANPMLQIKHLKRMVEQGVVITAVHEIYEFKSP